MNAAGQAVKYQASKNCQHIPVVIFLSNNSAGKELKSLAGGDLSFVDGQREYREECRVWDNVTQTLRSEQNVEMDCSTNQQCTGYDCDGMYVYNVSTPKIGNVTLTAFIKTPGSGVTICFQFVPAPAAASAATSAAAAVYTKPYIIVTKNV